MKRCSLERSQWYMCSLLYSLWCWKYKCLKIADLGRNYGKIKYYWCGYQVQRKIASTCIKKSQSSIQRYWQTMHMIDLEGHSIPVYAQWCCTLLNHNTQLQELFQQGIVTLYQLEYIHTDSIRSHQPWYRGINDLMIFMLLCSARRGSHTFWMSTVWVCACVCLPVGSCLVTKVFIGNLPAMGVMNKGQLPTNQLMFM